MELLAGIQKFSLRARVFSRSIFKDLIEFLKTTRDNLTLTSVKVVSLTVTSILGKFQQKILQFD